MCNYVKAADRLIDKRILQLQAGLYVYDPGSGAQNFIDNDGRHFSFPFCFRFQNWNKERPQDNGTSGGLQ